MTTKGIHPQETPIFRSIGSTFDFKLLDPVTI
jgi:hypothetical protein